METIEQTIARLTAENAALKEKQAKRQTLSLKVSAKGALSLYGNGRFPQTFYASQWEKILSHADQIKAFLVANADQLARKPE